jgi:hypothetical protein
MSRLVWLCAALCCASFPSLAIVGGKAVTLGGVGPAPTDGSASVVRIRVVKPEGERLCGGALIGHDATNHRALILTAAHCLYDDQERKGSVEARSPTVQRQRRGYLKHLQDFVKVDIAVGRNVTELGGDHIEFYEGFPKWVRSSAYLTRGVALRGLDLAILRLKNAQLPRELKPVAILRIPDAESAQLVGRTAHIFGYGRGRANPDVLEEKITAFCTRKAPCTVDGDKFSELIEYEGTQRKTLEGGDSGGPEVLVSQGKPYLIGINSVEATDDAHPAKSWGFGVLQGRWFDRFADWINDESGGIPVTVVEYEGNKEPKVFSPSTWSGKALRVAAYTAPGKGHDKSTSVLEEALLGAAASSAHATIAQLKQDIRDYQTAKALKTAPGRHTQLALLDQMDHRAYTFVGTRPPAAQLDAMLEFLDVLGVEHQETILAVAHGHEPIFFADNPARPASQAAQQAFDALAASTDGGLLTELIAAEGHALGGQHPVRLNSNLAKSADVRERAFRGEMLSAYARILSRDEGRKLVALLAGATHRTWIWPRYSWVDQNYSPERGQGAIAEPTGGGATTPGTGSGCSVSVEPEMRESDYADLDAQDHKILSPTWLGLAHELIHCSHYASGHYLRGALPKSEEKWQDPEEKATVTGGPGITENTLRNEHGLPARGRYSTLTGGPELWFEFKPAPGGH